MERLKMHPAIYKEALVCGILLAAAKLLAAYRWKPGCPQDRLALSCITIKRRLEPGTAHHSGPS